MVFADIRWESQNPNKEGTMKTLDLSKNKLAAYNGKIYTAKKVSKKTYQLRECVASCRGGMVYPWITNICLCATAKPFHVSVDSVSVMPPNTIPVL